MTTTLTLADYPNLQLGKCVECARTWSGSVAFLHGYFQRCVVNGHTVTLTPVTEPSREGA